MIEDETLSEWEKEAWEVRNEGMPSNQGYILADKYASRVMDLIQALRQEREDKKGLRAVLEVVAGYFENMNGLKKES